MNETHNRVLNPYLTSVNQKVQWTGQCNDIVEIFPCIIILCANPHTTLDQFAVASAKPSFRKVGSRLKWEIQKCGKNCLKVSKVTKSLKINKAEN